MLLAGYIETYSIEILRTMGQGPPLREEYEIQVVTYDSDVVNDRCYANHSLVEKGTYLNNCNIGTEGMFTVIQHTLPTTDPEGTVRCHNDLNARLAKLYIQSDTILDIQFKEVSVRKTTTGNRQSEYDFDPNSYKASARRTRSTPDFSSGAMLDSHNSF